MLRWLGFLLRIIELILISVFQVMDLSLLYLFPQPFFTLITFFIQPQRPYPPPPAAVSAVSHHGNHPAPPVLPPHGNFESNERSRSSLPQLSVEQQVCGVLLRVLAAL